MYVTHSKSMRSPKLSLQPIGKLSRNAGHVRIKLLDHITQPKESSYDGNPEGPGPTGAHVRILVQREHPQDVIVFVHRFAEVSSFLLI